MYEDTKILYYNKIFVETLTQVTYFSDNNKHFMYFKMI